MQTKRPARLNLKRRKLTPRQEMILTCYSAGMTQREVARKLKIDLNAMEYIEALLSDRYKEYEMSGCALKWQRERSSEK